MDDGKYHMLHWSVDEARLRKCSSTTTAKGTLLKIEIEVSDAYCLSSMMRAIQAAMRPAPKQKPTPKETQAAATRSLAAPLLKLTDRRNG